LLVKPAQGKMLLAMATNRQTLENEREFERHKAALAEAVKG
jgi:hypothetical protein